MPNAPETAVQPVAPCEITALSAADLSRAIADKAFSCVEVMTAYLDRIEALNPTFNAIISLRDRDALLAEAREADAALARGERKGWLHGMPWAVKDLSETKGLRTTWGSPLHAEHVPEADSLMASRIRGAGAIFIGKTNVPEFGFGSQTYNPVHGATGCAYDPSRTAGGSSGGAASAMALRMLPAADGSDMMGSLRNPAAFNNVYGHRPSWGRVPNSGAPDIYMSQLATEGPMGRTVEDMALLLETIAGPDDGAPLALPAEPEGWAARLGGDVKGMRIGWIGDWAGRYAIEDGVLDLCAGALKTFEELGCTVEPLVPDFDPERLWRSWLALRQFAIGGKLGALLDDPAKRGKLKPEALWEAEHGLRATGADVYAAAVIRTDWHRALLKLFERYDALALPSAQAFPFDIGTHWLKEVAGRKMETYHQWMEVVIPASLGGLPATNIPVGFDARGLPMGMQIIAPPKDDLKALRLAAAHERAADWVGTRLPPAIGG